MRHQRNQIAPIPAFFLILSSWMSTLVPFIMAAINISGYGSRVAKKYFYPAFAEGARCEFQPFLHAVNNTCYQIIKSLHDNNLHLTTPNQLRNYYDRKNQGTSPLENSLIILSFSSVPSFLFFMLRVTSLTCDGCCSPKAPQFTIGAAIISLPYFIVSLAHHSLTSQLKGEAQQSACIAGCFATKGNITYTKPIILSDPVPQYFSIQPGITTLYILGALTFAYMMDTAVSAAFGHTPPWVNWVTRTARRGGQGISRCFRYLWCCGNTQELRDLRAQVRLLNLQQQQGNNSGNNSRTGGYGATDTTVAVPARFALPPAVPATQQTGGAAASPPPPPAYNVVCPEGEQGPRAASQAPQVPQARRPISLWGNNSGSASDTSSSSTPPIPNQ